MARFRWPRRRTAEVAKAPAAAGGTLVPLADVLAALDQRSARTAEPMPRPEEWFRAPFGPGTPIVPAPVNAARPDTGRAEPRTFDYPTSWNLYTNPDRLIPWHTLRGAADAPIVRQCIEHRQKELTGLEWDITVSEGAIEEAVQAGVSKAEAVTALQRRLAPDIHRLAEFWQAPDAEQGLEFADWLWQLLEEQLVLDAVAIYPRLTYGGDLLALRAIDGSTIKPLLDEHGARPRPPAPAFQQILHGFPRGEFTADTDQDGQVMPGLSADQLIYKRRAVRTWTPYGLSPVEHVLTDLDLLLKRMGWMRSEYTDGVTPQMILENTGAAGWSPKQTLDYERDFNDQQQADQAQRFRARILPPGIKPAPLHGDVTERYKPDYDMHVIKLVCSHFGVPPSELGFSEVKGLGNAGFSEAQANINYRVGLFPEARWWARLLTRISRTHLGMPAELEFKFLGIEEEDGKDADAIAEARVRSGRTTLNEERDRLGLPRYEAPEANAPMIFTGSGLTPVEGAAEPPPPPVIGPGAPGPGGAGRTSPGGEGGEGRQEGGGPAAAGGQAVKAEVATFRRWARKNPAAARRFQFASPRDLVLKIAPDLGEDERAAFKAGEIDPKGWAGWEHDEALAAHYAPLIAHALVRAIRPAQLARAWVKAGPVRKAAEAPAARVWLDERGTTAHITTALEGPLLDLWVEATYLGRTAGSSAATGEAPDWQGWAPGDTAAARRLNPIKGLARKVKAALRRLARTRVADLARALTRGRDEGWTAEQIDAEIRRVLEAAARQIALTEVTAGSSYGAQQAYKDAGVESVRWVTDPASDVCAICADNEDGGAVAAGDRFPSGDLAPPAHPNCRCSLEPAV